MYKLTKGFEELFQGKAFLHRRPHQGDVIASWLYEDLFDLGRSHALVEHVTAHTHGLNAGNRVTGLKARRGDGTFGEFVPNVKTIVVPGFSVARGSVAELEIGSETKILSTAFGKQRRERAGDINDQAATFKRLNHDAITVAIIGVNHATSYASYEGERITRTDGKKHKHPAQEAAGMILVLDQEVRANYDAFILLPYSATNDAPFPFSWVNQSNTFAEYGASLVRLSNLYERRFA